MMINFSEEDKTRINDIITKYRKINSEYEEYKKQLDLILDKVKLIETSLNNCKEEEDNLMKELHKKYNNFSLQDIYNSLNDISYERKQ